MIEFEVHRLWTWMPMDGITIGRHIFLKNVQDKTLLEHELVHVEQQALYGWWFWFSYLLLLPALWSPWRARWEGEAYAAQAKIGHHIEDLAQIMAGPRYLWPCSKKRAEAEIRRWL